LDALEIAIPSTVTEALMPVTGCVKLSEPEEDTVKFEALPELLATIASREPVESVITFALTPRLSLLISLATSVSVCDPSVVMVVEEPPAVVMVKLPAGSAVDPLASALEDQESVLARLLTTTT
jgi:hypothetical protein